MRCKISSFSTGVSLFSLAFGVLAAPLPFGDNSITGTSVAAQPSLAGTILEDVFAPYAFSGAGATVSGMVESRVVRSTLNGTLDFYWRIVPDPTSTGGIDALRMVWSAGVIQDANWRSDDVGNVAPDTARNFDIRPRAAVNFLFSGPGVGPTDSSRFFFVRTDATAYDRSGFYDLLCAPNDCISPLFSTFAPVLPQPLTITCSAALVLECTNGEAVGTLEANVSDAGGQSVAVVWSIDGTPFQTNNIPSGGNITTSTVAFTYQFGFGDHVVVASASNGETDPVTCSTTVKVIDTIPPRIARTAATPDVLWPPNHRMIPVNVTVEAVDNCDPSPVVKIITVTSNEPETSSAPDWEITGAKSLNLLAERLGRGQGRVYTIHVQCEDKSGNASTASVEVTVPHD